MTRSHWGRSRAAAGGVAVDQRSPPAPELPDARPGNVLPEDNGGGQASARLTFSVISSLAYRRKALSPGQLSSSGRLTHSTLYG